MHPEPILHPKVDITIGNDYDSELGNAFGYQKQTNQHRSWAGCRDNATSYLANNIGRRTRFIEVLYNVYTRQACRYKIGSQYLSAKECCWNAARFFWAIEGHMGWWDRTRIHSTQYNNCIVAYLSGGWWQNYISINLVTLMLRVAPYFREGHSLNDVFNCNTMTHDTIPALWTYLEGNQFYTPTDTVGWHSRFNRMRPGQLERTLIPRQHVEERAYHLWEKSGRPANQHNYYFQQAALQFQFVPLIHS